MQHRLISTLLPVFACLLLCGAARAACPVPNTLTNGTTADATQVMANFNSIATCATDADNLTSGNVPAAQMSTNLSAALDTAIGNTRGDVLYRGAAGWSVLPPGTSGYVLSTGGAGADPSWVAQSGGGGSLPTIRGSNIQSSNSNSFTVTWPSGTVAGDLAVIFAGSGWSFNNPSGWITLSNIAGSNANGAIWGKVLTSADITAGSVTITSVNSYYGCVAIVTFDGSTTAALGFNGNQNGGGASPVSVNATGYLAGAMGLYWGYTRGSTTGTFAQGTLLQTTSTSDGSAVLYTGNPTPPFVQSASFNSTSSGSGYYLGIGFVSGP